MPAGGRWWRVRRMGEMQVMLTRRNLLTGMAVAPLVGAPGFRSAFASGTVSETSPDVAMAKLIAGNARHAKGEYSADNGNLLRDRMSGFADGQDPHSVIVACSDSRVVPELIFDAPPGDLFVMRVAGNVVSPFVIGSAEYAVLALKVRLVVIMGHSGCGAISAAVQEIEKGEVSSGSLQQLVDQFLPAVVRVRRDKPKNLVQAAVEENTRIGIDRMSASMPTLAPLVTSGVLKVVAAVYDLSSGKVNFIG